MRGALPTLSRQLNLGGARNSPNFGDGAKHSKQPKIGFL